MGVVQGSQLRPLLSVIRSGCVCLAQISQWFVCGHVHRADDGRLDMARIKKPRQMIITENRGAISKMSWNGLLILRYDLVVTGMGLSSMGFGVTETAHPRGQLDRMNI